jgi:2-succinyl-5-enolpyruvyl-6-hydroxy-3-cyclohexene-1-carboxylate synthase
VNPKNLLTEWSRLLIGSLARAGVEQVVVSPGSRSTPFVWAAMNEPGLKLEVIVDERSAGFFAVAQAKLSGRPTLLLCTSGSAGANYFPAVVEAAMTATPLIVMTADRPFELQGCAAPQTIDQIRLFGHHVRRYFELGLPDADQSALRGLTRVATQAVHTARHPEPGPVHLNVRAKKPLEPQTAGDGGSRELGECVSALLGSVTSASPPPQQLPDEAALRRIARSCVAARKGVVVCGGLMPAQAGLREPITRLLEHLRFPVLCEAPSQLRIAPVAPRLAPFVCDAFDVVLGSAGARRELAPDLVLQIGAPCTSGMLERFLTEHAAIERHVMAEFGWPDPQSSAASVTIGNLGLICERLMQELEDEPRSNADEQAGFLRRFTAANAVAWNVIETELGGLSALSEGGAVRITLDSLPERSLLALGNSLPIREVDTYSRARNSDALVFTQRGTNGIDGLISGAAGAAATSGRPTTLLVGDLGFLHDVGGLFAARSLRVPFVVVVLNNDGGRIFELLPLASTPGMQPELLEPWIVSHGLELKPAAELYRHRYARVERADQLRSALREAHGTIGCTVIEVVVAPQGAADQLSRIRKRTEVELARLFGAGAGA